MTDTGALKQSDKCDLDNVNLDLTLKVTDTSALSLILDANSFSSSANFPDGDGQTKKNLATENIHSNDSKHISKEVNITDHEILVPDVDSGKANGNEEYELYENTDIINEGFSFTKDWNECEGAESFNLIGSLTLKKLADGNTETTRFLNEQYKLNEGDNISEGFSFTECTNGFKQAEICERSGNMLLENVSETEKENKEQQLTIRCSRNKERVKYGKASNSQPFLPPCKVCGDKASGIHYSVSTCEPCKGFFRRSVIKVSQQKQSYICAGSGNCAFGPESRQACPYCRYKKCLQVGMSMNAKKSGRYTYEKRTQITQEVKRLEQTEREFTNLNIKEAEVGQIIENLVTAQRKLNPNLAEHFQGNSKALDEQAIIFNTYLRKMDLFGNMAALPVGVYEDFYKVTGIDIDNRQEIMKRVIARIEKIIRSMIEFMRSIPRIKMLSMSDQMALVKASHFEFGFLGFYPGMNKELNVITGDGIGVHRAEISAVFDNTFLDDVFHCASGFQCLNLAEEELALCRGIVICFSDRCALQEPEKVDDIQWSFVNCLRYYAKCKGYNPDKRLSQIFDRLTSLRSVSEMCQILDKEKTNWPAAKEHPLVMDVLS